MTRTITATYENRDALANVFDELINDGLDREKIYLDDDHLQVKVMIPNAIEPEISSILKRHHPTEMH